LDRPVRVISTSETRVWPLVERGAFLASLYYRLNVLCLDLTRTPAGT
jgi:transcriptional regulator of aromatic amino acid metabolism